MRRVNAESIRCRVQVEGIVQGVGFRPFVHAIAHRLGLSGMVGNDDTGVFIEVEGPVALVGRFQEALAREAPPLAVIEGISARPVPPTGGQGFFIAGSVCGGQPRTFISPDIATCDDCLSELADPGDRRYRYPFVNCTNCGPRFTIVRGVPYDRPSTTMASFPMCERCRAEYDDPSDRRFHAQPNACPECGPSLRLVDRTRGRIVTSDPVR